MQYPEFIRCCQAVEEGDEVTLGNVESGSTGRLLFCSIDRFEVMVNGRRESWPVESSEEIEIISESPHANL